MELRPPLCEEVLTKKYIFRFALAVFTAVISTSIYFGCTDDETNLFFDLTGRWTGWGQDAEGGGRIELQINQDTTGNITGFGYTFDEKMDTMAFIRTVSNGQVTVTGYTSQCRPTIDLEVTSDGVKMTGTARDIDSADCNMDPINLLSHKVQEATVDITGSWNGTHTGTDGTGSFLMTVTQSGSIVTGHLYDVGDTSTVTGRVLEMFLRYCRRHDMPCLFLHGSERQHDERAFYEYR